MEEIVLVNCKFREKFFPNPNPSMGKHLRSPFPSTVRIPRRIRHRETQVQAPVSISRRGQSLSHPRQRPGEQSLYNGTTRPMERDGLLSRVRPPSVCFRTGETGSQEWGDPTGSSALDCTPRDRALYHPLEYLFHIQSRRWKRDLSDHAHGHARVWAGCPVVTLS